MVKYVLVIDPVKERHDKFQIGLAQLSNSFRLLSAYTGSEGLQIVRQVKPPLILINVQVKGMNALTCVKRIRSLRRMPEIAIKLYDANTGADTFHDHQLAATLSIDNLRDTVKDIEYFLQHTIADSLMPGR